MRELDGKNMFWWVECTNKLSLFSCSTSYLHKHQQLACYKNGYNSTILTELTT